MRRKGTYNFERYRRQIVIEDKAVTVLLEIDWFHVFRELGLKAYRNRGKSTRALAGLIKVKVK